MSEALVGSELEEWLAAVNAYHLARQSSQPTPRQRVANTILRESNLQRVDLSEIDFHDCDLSGADLSGAKLMGSTWTDCRFGLTNLSGAQLQGATFNSGCVFEGATLNDCVATRAKFVASDFHNATAVGANFDQVDFGGSRLANTDLTRASLNDAFSFVLDRAVVRSTEFSATASDPWSILRRTYTGPRFVLNFMLLVMFVLTLVAKTFAYQVLVLIESAPGLAMGIDAYCLQYVCEDVRISDVLLGFRDGAAFFVISGLIYNLLRFVLTFGVSALREQEERSGRSPAYDPPLMLDDRRRRSDWLRRYRQFYRWMYGVHRWVMFPLWIVVMISFLGALYGIATDIIRLPVQAG